MGSWAEDAEALIRSVTQPQAVPLVPEVTLHLLQPGHPLWTATPEEAASAGLELPYWAFAWPGGQALARWLFDRPGLVRDRRVLDVGCGGAIEGVAAARCGAARVSCLDVDPIAGAAARLNARLNGVDLDVVVRDALGAACDAFACDVVLVGDLTFDETITARLVPWLRGHQALGRLVLVGDAGRVSLPPDFVEQGAHAAPFDGNPSGSALWRIAIRSLGA